MKAAETETAKLIELIVQAGMQHVREDWKPRPLAATKAMGPG